MTATRLRQDRTVTSQGQKKSIWPRLALACCLSWIVGQADAETPSASWSKFQNGGHPSNTDQ